MLFVYITIYLSHCHEPTAIILLKKIARHWGILKISQIPVWIWGWYIFKILETQMTGYLGNFMNSYAFEKLPSDSPRNLGNSPDSQTFWIFPRFPGIWEIPQIPRHWENSPDFLNSYRTLSLILEISKIEVSYNWKIKHIKIFKEFGEFPRFPGIWEIIQISRFLGEFPRFPDIWGIPQDSQVFWEFPILTIFLITVTPSWDSVRQTVILRVWI